MLQLSRGHALCDAHSECVFDLVTFRKPRHSASLRWGMESLLQLKQALDAGLITQGDYDAGKHAFLRAQQVRV